jgi:arginine N-succinyltransferase
MLESEGFRYECYVDIFDGGPTMTARTDDVASVRDARAATVSARNLTTGEKALLATGSLADFRCCYGQRQVDGDEVAIDAATAALLRLGGGDTVWSIAR